MFLHTFTPSPVILKIGHLKIYWYGFLIMIGVLLGIIVSSYLLKRYKNILFNYIGNRGLRIQGILSFFKEFLFEDLFIYLITGSLVGARLFHIIAEYRYYLANPLDIFKIWNGGVWIYGAIIGGLLALFVYLRRFAKKGNLAFLFCFMADLLAPGLALAQALGRWGNYFNQELYGLPTKMGWGIPIDVLNRVVGFSSYKYFHPVFLYESMWCLSIAILLLFLHLKRIHNIFLVQDERDYKRLCRKTGEIFLVYLVLYSFGRFMFEFVRIDPVPSIFGFRATQIIAAIMMILAVTFIIMRKFKDNFDCLTQSEK